jgi:hypothetical protein
MGCAKDHALARERKFYVKAESTYGTLVFPAGTDAIKVRDGTSLGTKNTERMDRDDNRATRSVQERITGKQGPHEWVIEKYLIPSGTAGTPPDDSVLWTAAFGVYTNTPATSDAYTLTDTQGTQCSVSLWDNLSDVEMEAQAGGIVQTVTIKGAGGDPPTVTFSGVGADHITTGDSDLDLALAGGESSIIVDDQYGGETGSLIQIGTDDNSGSGYQVTGRSGGVSDETFTGSGLDDADFDTTQTYTGTTVSVYEVEIDATGTPDTFKWRKDSGAYTSGVSITGAGYQTLAEGVEVGFSATTGHTLGDKWSCNVGPYTKWAITPAVGGPVALAADVLPFTPTETTAGSPIPGVLGSATLDGVTFPALNYEVTLNNNHNPIHDEVFQSKVTDFTEDLREVVGKLQVRCREDQTTWLNRRADFESIPLVLTIGTTAGSICTISLPTVEMEYEPVEKPAQGSAIINIPFKALGTQNEISVTFT